MPGRGRDVRDTDELIGEVRQPRLFGVRAGAKMIICRPRPASVQIETVVSVQNQHDDRRVAMHWLCRLGVTHRDGSPISQTPDYH